MSDMLLMRLVRSDGALLIEQSLVPASAVEEAAEEAGELANAAAREGWGWALEVMDPDGDIAPAGEWIAVDWWQPDLFAEESGAWPHEADAGTELAAFLDQIAEEVGDLGRPFPPRRPTERVDGPTYRQTF